MARKMLFAAIVVTTFIFSLSHFVSMEYWIVAFSFLIGSIWLLLEIYKKSAFPSFFFASFIGIAILGSLNHTSSPMILLGLSTDLAAWDLSRFFTRIMDLMDNDAKSELYKKHLYKLSISLCIGYVLALLPVFIRLSMNFIVLFILTLLAMTILRKSILYLRNEHKNMYN